MGLQTLIVSKYRDVASLTVLRRSSSILALCSYYRARMDPLNMDPADSSCGYTLAWKDFKCIPCPGG